MVCADVGGYPGWRWRERRIVSCCSRVKLMRGREALEVNAG